MHDDQPLLDEVERLVESLTNVHAFAGNISG
jgi:hypothetical protein